MSFRDFNNTLNTVSFSSLTNQFLWMIGSIAFTVVACWLMVRPDQFNATGVLIASGSGMRAVGFDLAASLLFAWTGKSVVTAASRFGKSATSEKYVKAKAEGKAAAASKNAPAIQAGNVEKVKNGYSEGAREDHEWAHTRQDDERGSE